MLRPAVLILLALAPYGVGQAADMASSCRLKGGSLVPLSAEACKIEGGMLADPSCSLHHVADGNFYAIGEPLTVKD